MASDFLKEFAYDSGFSEDEIRVLAAADVRSAEDIDSLVNAFPSIADLGVRLPLVSNAAAQHTSAVYSTVSAAPPAQSANIPLGALPPPGSAVVSPVALSSPAQPAGAAPASLAAAIDLRLPSWPVRDQNPRGTCVAFGAIACAEHLARNGQGKNLDYSEQFLYWSIKTNSGDPSKATDGTWLIYADQMLAQGGVCRENLWPYVQQMVNPVSGATSTAPSAPAIKDGASNLFASTTYAKNPKGAAQTVLGLLQLGRPVAVCLPCFRDPLLPNGPINWALPVGWMYGRVLNPPPKSVVKGGHCVCVTGFVPDQNEQNGGYFIFRNSWGAAWANLAPSTGNTLSPEQGYGEISATYVDTYCWELLQL